MSSQKQLKVLSTFANKEITKTTKKKQPATNNPSSPPASTSSKKRTKQPTITEEPVEEDSVPEPPKKKTSPRKSPRAVKPKFSDLQKDNFSQKKKDCKYREYQKKEGRILLKAKDRVYYESVSLSSLHEKEEDQDHKVIVIGTRVKVFGKEEEMFVAGVSKPKIGSQYSLYCFSKENPEVTSLPLLDLVEISQTPTEEKEVLEMAGSWVQQVAEKTDKKKEEEKEKRNTLKSSEAPQSTSFLFKAVTDLQHQVADLQASMNQLVQEQKEIRRHYQLIFDLSEHNHQQSIDNIMKIIGAFNKPQ
jgi:hypothetical protein